MSGLTEQERLELLATEGTTWGDVFAAVERIVVERERAARDEWSQRYRELADASALVEAALVREREAVAERERAAQVRALREAAEWFMAEHPWPESRYRAEHVERDLRGRADRIDRGDR